MLDKLKTPAFWIVLVGIICDQLQPMLVNGGSVDILGTIKIILVAFMGLVATAPGAKKNDVVPPAV